LGKGYSSPALASLQSINSIQQQQHQLQFPSTPSSSIITDILTAESSSQWDNSSSLLSSSSSMAASAMAATVGFSVSNQEVAHILLFFFLV
jgi:hypothetical protein